MNVFDQPPVKYAVYGLAIFGGFIALQRVFGSGGAAAKLAPTALFARLRNGTGVQSVTH